MHTSCHRIYDFVDTPSSHIIIFITVNYFYRHEHSEATIGQVEGSSCDICYHLSIDLAQPIAICI